jgi:hypothetical protein
MSCIEFQGVLNANDKNDCFSNATSAKENGKKFIFDNRTNKSLCRVKVDKCLIADNSVKKCDFLFKVYEPSKYYLVELKGLKAEDGVKQIVSTYEIVNNYIKESVSNYTGVIVSSAVPAAAEQRFRKLQESCFKSKRLLIKKTHMVHVERI